MSSVGEPPKVSEVAIPAPEKIGKKESNNTQPSKSALPKFLKEGLNAAGKDFTASFGLIGQLLASPFMGFNKPKNKMEAAENIFWCAVLPATLPTALLGAALLLPITLISGVVSFVAGKSTQEMVKPPKQTNTKEDSSVDRL